MRAGLIMDSLSIFISPQLPPTAASIDGLAVETNLQPQRDALESAAYEAAQQHTNTSLQVHTDTSKSGAPASFNNVAQISPEWALPSTPAWTGAGQPCLFLPLHLEESPAGRLHQGGIDSCWAIAAMASLRAAQPQILKRAFRTHELQTDGRVQLLLYIAGAPCSITVDGFLPVHPLTGAPAFASMLPAAGDRSSPPVPPLQELWPSYLEKGIAQACVRGYAGLAQGHMRDAFRLLAGCPVVSASVPGGLTRELELLAARGTANGSAALQGDACGAHSCLHDRLWSFLQRSLVKGGAVGASCGQAAEPTVAAAGMPPVTLPLHPSLDLQVLNKWSLQTDHAYALLGVAEEGDKTRAGQGGRGSKWVQLLDPWQGGVQLPAAPAAPQGGLVGPLQHESLRLGHSRLLPWAVFCQLFRHVDVCAPPANWSLRAPAHLAVAAPGPNYNDPVVRDVPPGPGAPLPPPSRAGGVAEQQPPAVTCLVLQPDTPCSVTAVASRRSGRLHGPKRCGDQALKYLGEAGLWSGDSLPVGSAPAVGAGPQPRTPEGVSAVTTDDVKRSALHRADLGLCLVQLVGGASSLGEVVSLDQLAVIADCPRSFDEWVNLHGAMLDADSTYVIVPVSCSLLSAPGEAGGRWAREPPLNPVDNPGVNTPGPAKALHFTASTKSGAPPLLPKSQVGSTVSYCVGSGGGGALGPVPRGQLAPLPSPQHITLEAHCSAQCLATMGSVPLQAYACVLLARVRAAGVHSLVFGGGSKGPLQGHHEQDASLSIAPPAGAALHGAVGLAHAEPAACFHQWTLQGDGGLWLAVGNSHPSLHLATCTTVEGVGQGAMADSASAGSFNIVSTRSGWVYADVTPPGHCRLLCVLTQGCSEAPFGFQYSLGASAQTQGRGAQGGGKCGEHNQLHCAVPH